MESKQKEISKTTDKKKLKITKKELMEKEFTKFFKDIQNAIKEWPKYTHEQKYKAIEQIPGGIAFLEKQCEKHLEEQLKHPTDFALRFTEAWRKRISLPFNLSERLKNKSKLFPNKEEEKKFTKAMVEFISEVLKFEEIQRKVEKEFLSLQKKTKLIRFLQSRLPELPVVSIDRATSRELLPLFLTKGIFSKFNKIRHIEDIINKEEEKIGRKPTAKEKRDLEVRTGEYKKNGYVWREFPEYAIGFGYEHFLEYIQKIEKEYQKKNKEVEAKPFLFPYMKTEIQEVLRKAKIYKKGQELAYGILGEIFLQKKLNGVSLLKQTALYYMGNTPKDKQAYQDMKEILNSLRWLDYKIIGRGNSKIRGAIGNFIYNIVEKPKEYVLDINPVYVGCVEHFFSGDNKSRTIKERKEIFSRGFFTFPMKALAISGGFSVSTQEFRNYILREKGNEHLNTSKYKVISQKIQMYIQNAGLNYSRRDKNYKAFTEEVLPTLIRNQFIVKIVPSLDKLKTLRSKKCYETNLRIYMQNFPELDKSLEEVLRKKSAYLSI